MCVKQIQFRMEKYIWNAWSGSHAPLECLTVKKIGSISTWHIPFPEESIFDYLNALFAWAVFKFSQRTMETTAKLDRLTSASEWHWLCCGISITSICYMRYQSPHKDHVNDFHSLNYFRFAISTDQHNYPVRRCKMCAFVAVPQTQMIQTSRILWKAKRENINYKNDVWISQTFV